MVSNNINPQYQYQYQTAQNMSPSFNAMPAQIAPNMTGQLEDTSLGKSLDKSQKDKYLTLGLTVPAYFGLSKLHQIITKANGGEYEKSLIGRIAGFGDKIANGRFANSGFMTSVKSGCKSVREFVTKNIIQKNKALSAMVYTPSVPESQMAKGVESAVEDVTKDFVTFVEKFVKDGNKLTDLGLDETIFEAIKKDPKAKANLDKIKDICSNVGASKTVKTGKIIKRTLSLDQVGNRLKAMTESSKLGKFLAKAGNRGAFGLFVGGGIFMIMSAHAIADATIRTKNAEKGDKFSTFMEGFLGNISWVVTFPLGLKLMNAVGGLANMGKTPEQVAKKAEKLADMKKAATQADYDIAKAAWKLAKKDGAKLNFFQKILKFAGDFLTLGRGVPNPYLPKATTFGGKLSNFFKKIPYVFRNKFLAVAIGLGTYMTIFSPIVDKLFVKASHAVFGKPKHSMYDDEEETKETAQNPVQNQAQNIAENQVAATQPSKPVELTSPSNLLNMYQQNGNNPQQPQQNNNNNGQLEPVRTYIPSAMGVQLQEEKDDPTVMAALQRADIAEKQALEALAMKF